jgi:DNA repair photolyase
MPLKTTAGNHGEAAKGRGSPINPEGRFEKVERESADDGWFQDPGEDDRRPKTVVAIERAKSIIAHNDSPDLGFSQSLNPYRGCEHGCVFCLSGDTPILMATGRTLPLSEVRAGDEIYGTEKGKAFRYYKKTRVLAHWSTIKPAFRVTLEDGTILVASGDHRFLTDRGWKHVTGAGTGPGCRPHLTTSNSLLGTGAFAEGPSENDDYRRGYLCGMVRGDGHLKKYVYNTRGRSDIIRGFRLALCDHEALLRAQDYLLDFDIATQEFQFLSAQGGRRAMHAIRFNCDWKFEAVSQLIAWPMAASRAWFAGFLAGIFDAEGGFNQGILRISNTDGEIIAWIGSALHHFGLTFVVERYPHEARKPMNVVRITGGLREHLRFFHTVRPAITRKMDIEGQALKSAAKLGVVAIEPLGRAMRLYDITTGTEDFIANGVVSHNCYARPSHAYLGLSPGIDFETRLFAKPNAAELLREELSKPGYKCENLVLGVNTDAYQPIEREHRITRAILEVCAEANQPIGLITKSALIERDIDILAPMAAKKLVSTTISITTLDHGISRYMEPRASAPARRLLAVARLSAAGIPVNVNVAPVIPFLTDSELESILEASAKAGATTAAYTLLRLPWEVKDIFRAWLEERFPLKAAHVMSRVHDMRGGRDNDPNFGSRMKGQGLFAELLKQRFDKACTRLGLNNREWAFELDCSQFRPPGPKGQATLF